MMKLEKEIMLKSDNEYSVKLEIVKNDLKNECFELGKYKSIKEEHLSLLGERLVNEIIEQINSKFIIIFNESKMYGHLNDAYLLPLLNLTSEYKTLSNNGDICKWLLRVLWVLDEFSEELKTQIADNMLEVINSSFINYMAIEINHQLNIYYKNFEYICDINNSIEDFFTEQNQSALYNIKILIVLLSKMLGL